MILITGATGMFGSRVLRETVARRAEVRALAHSPASARQLRAGGADVVIGDLDEPESLTAVFAGIDTAFIVTPMDERIAIRETNALRAAQQAGIRRIVKLYGAVRHHGDPLDSLHLASIEAIRQSGLSWALVSPNSVMDTTMLSQAEAIRSLACLVGCAGDGRVGLVAADDVARAAAIVLTERDEVGANYELTGPEALSMAEMAGVLSEVLGRSITYQDMPETEFRKLLVEQVGVPEDQVDVQVMLHFAAWKRGDAALVTGTYLELTGKPPTSLKEWMAARQDAFAPADAHSAADSR
jgi:uncharacterized protein YbjT (DUF2867 family)